jgi:hypothetical protein
LKHSRDTINTRSSFGSALYRQSFLAELEFKRRLIYWNFSQGSEEYRSENETGGVFFNLIMNYITSYYDILSTADELVPFLKMLNHTHLAPIQARFQAFTEKMSEMSTNKTRFMKALLTCHKVLKIIGGYGMKHY